MVKGTLEVVPGIIFGGMELAEVDGGECFPLSHPLLVDSFLEYWNEIWMEKINSMSRGTDFWIYGTLWRQGCRGMYGSF
jgi:hypothetical protein